MGYAFKQGDVPSGQTVLISETNARAVIKRRWNDGSAKHAIIVGRTNLTANVAKTITLTSGSDPGGTALTSADITAAAPSASVQCGSIGTVNLSSLLASPFRTWVSNSQMVECHYRSAVGSDASLVVWFHVRLWAGGRMWVRAFVENGYIGQSPSTQTYTATVIIGGATVYNSSVTHYAFARWTVDAWIGVDPQVTVSHNTTYLAATKLVPNYWKKNPASSVLTGLTQTYAPMQLTPNPVSMGAGGGSLFIGVIPNWDALYVTTGDSRAYKAVLSASSAFNTYSIYRRDSSTHLPGIPSNHASTTYAGSGNGSFSWSNAAGTWELNHLVNGGYLAYLITGDFWHYETLAFNASACYFSISITGGTGTNKMLRAETRGCAWMQNVVGHFAAIAATEGLGANDTALATDYRALLARQATGWKAVVDTPGINQLGSLYEYNTLPSLWQTQFWVIANGQVGMMEPLADMTNWAAVKTWMYRFIVGNWGATGTLNWHFSRAGSEAGGGGNPVRLAATDTTDPLLFYDTWGEVWNRYLGSNNAETTNTLKSDAGQSNDVTTAVTFHRWAPALAALSYAVEDGADGSSASWSRLVGATNFTSLENGSAPSNFNDTPLWGIVPRNWSTTMPTWYPSAGAIAEINSGTTIGSSVRAAGGNSYAGTDPDNIVAPWSGGAIVYVSGQPYLVVYGGGHGDSYYNGIHKFGPLFGPGSNSPAWSLFLAPSAVGAQNNDPTYTDGRQCSVHSYNMLTGVNSRLFCMATNDNDSGSSGAAFSFTPNGQTVLATNPTTGKYGCSAHYNGSIYYIGGDTDFDRLRIYNIAANTWSSESNATIALGNYVSMAIDTKRGKLLVAGSNVHAPTGGAVYWDLTTMAQTKQRTPPPSSVASLEYDDLRDVFVSYQSGSATVQEASAATLAAGGDAVWTTRTFTGSAPAASPAAGQFGRFRYVPELKGYISVPNLETNVYFFRST